ncbi:MAG: midcut-by-XrtH protein [Betaproteobacteria bacterium]|nr:midcut-by-XrtH protein [Betaproteobacteria bacterium]
MKASRPRALTAPVAVLISGLGLLAVAPAALAQSVQNLTVSFENFLPVAPLSDWLTAGIALLLAASAVVVLRRRQGLPGRLFGWLLAVVAGTTLFTAVGQRTMSDANAVMVAPAISLVVSPGSLDVLPYAPTSPLDVVVTNNSGQTARITAIELDTLIFMNAARVQAKQVIIGEYAISPASSCAVGTVLSVGNTCIVTLDFQVPT